MSIRLRSTRGAVGKTPFGIALQERLERDISSGRATSGKRAARSGRVQWLDVSSSTARADVLDDDGQLYSARLDVRPFRDGDLKVFHQVVAAYPLLAAQVAGGTVPEDAAAHLRRSGVDLVPEDSRDLTHDCSCLDWPGPCKHVAALGYVLVEAVDEAPMHLVTLRGLGVEDLAVTRAGGGSTGNGGSGDVGLGSGDPAGSGVEGDQAASSAEIVELYPGSREIHDGGTAVRDDETVPQQGPRLFVPAETNTQILRDVLGEDFGNILGSFYGARDRRDSQDRRD